MSARRFAIAAFALIAGVAAWTAHSIFQPYAGFESPIRFEVERGTSTLQLAERLRKEGVIRWEWQFLLLRALHPSAVLQAGEYSFSQPAPPATIFDRIARGDVHYYEISIPEGSNLFEIAAIVEDTGIFSRQQFLAAAREPALIRDLAPDARSLEGYLFPSTYRITRYTTAPQFCKQMTDEFRKAWSGLGAQGNVHHVVTLASLVEEETGDPAERVLVASVFQNRLDRGHRLQCDPTTIYAALLESRFDGVIHRSDLDSKHPYNTYQHPGLPPGPIANPGLASLRAALQPAQTDFLFFVAKPGSRSHRFSATLHEHEEAVAAYRRGIQNIDMKPTNGEAR